ncbi:hypothetical protein GOBAR_AA19137 [Gossypium barbadense]|uniref:Late embryogenesis abundant protein LEA-2 subgroup domain-containing protein n=1 Tax=Gossypium barbadense TaxID=3634 RepID=A0A2P5XDX2_GOSBA|nr:hypothetical protein GOBAR_AA19137 [Gossypium barbadense]
MTDHQQRIHPVVEVEAPAPTTPLVPHGSATSEKGSPIQQRPPQRTIPVRPPPPPRKRSCCCKCICWTVSLIVVLLIILGATIGILYLVFRPQLPKYSIDSLRIISLIVVLLIILGATIGILYLVFRPQLPKYSIDSLRISDLRLNFDMTLYAKFDVKITANNPNKKIGIYYEKGGRLSVWYTNSKLCEGSLPKFYQGHQNITKLEVVLTGQTQSGSTLMSALQEQQQTGQIPLDLKVHAPVAVKLGKLKMRKVKILGECKLVVDSLSANNIISIKASNCKFRLKL